MVPSGFLQHNVALINSSNLWGDWDYVNAPFLISFFSWASVSIGDLGPPVFWVGIWCVGELFLLIYIFASLESWILILFSELQYVLLIFCCCSDCPRFGWWEPLQTTKWFLYRLCPFDMSSSFLEHFLNFSQDICLLEIIFLLVWKTFSPLRSMDAIFSFTEHHSNVSSQPWCLKMWP